ncbi:DUF7146 domain-containing protein [Teichococcus aerofrigidensis]
MTAATARELAEKLGLRRSYGGAWRGACPACGYPTTFSVREQDGRPLWWCASCQDKAALTAAVRAALGEDWTPPPPPAVIQHRDGPSPARKRAWAERMWSEAVPVTDTPAETYLRARRVWEAWRAFPSPEVGKQLRYHPRAAHPATDRRFPCLLALVRRATDGEPLAVHRTYLRPDGSGKADVEPQKATLGSVAGGVVMLHAPVAGRPLVLGEGNETALAASHLLGAPCWAAVAAGNLANLDLPPLPACDHVLIGADADPPGRDAAATAARRWRDENRRVRVATPDNDGEDFADLLARKARENPNGR